MASIFPKATIIVRKIFAPFIYRKLNRSIELVHVKAVITILFEQMHEDWKLGKDLKIANFMTVKLVKTNPKKYFNLQYQKVMQAPGYHLLKFKVFRPLNRRLNSLFDI